MPELGTGRSGAGDGEQGETLGFLAAWALARTGQEATAIEILHALIPRDLADDSAFELLNSVEGSGALSFYEELVRRNPFNARPPMWRGDLLLRIGMAQAAEQVLSSEGPVGGAEFDWYWGAAVRGELDAVWNLGKLQGLFR